MLGDSEERGDAGSTALKGLMQVATIYEQRIFQRFMHALHGFFLMEIFVV